MSDRIAVIRSGRVEQVARPDVMWTSRPATRFVAEFIGDAIKRDGPRGALVRTRDPGGRPWKVTCACSTPLERGQDVIPPFVTGLLSSCAGQHTPNVLKGVIVESYFARSDGHAGRDRDRPAACGQGDERCHRHLRARRCRDARVAA